MLRLLSQHLSLFWANAYLNKIAQFAVHADVTLRLYQTVTANLNTAGDVNIRINKISITDGQLS